MSRAIHDIHAERLRQQNRLGYEEDHDDEHDDGSLAMAAAYYTLMAVAEHNVDKGFLSNTAANIWPASWDTVYCKPKDQRSNLVRAGALIAAEIDRLDRAAGFKASAREHHGMVLTDEECSYDDLVQYGKITITFSYQDGVQVYSEGFDFAHASSCRQTAAKAMAWGRDVLAQQVEGDRLVPGGQISNGVD